MGASSASAAATAMPQPQEPQPQGDDGRIEVRVLRTEKPSIAVVDYRMGNLKSVERGLQAVGADAFITSDAHQIAAADAVVLPGVGAFADAAASMNDLSQMDAIRSAIADGAPFLGICLGMQLLFTDGVEGASEEAPAHGLGLISGTCRRMPKQDAQGNRYKVPHVGWNSVEAPLGMGVSDHPLLRAKCHVAVAGTVVTDTSRAAGETRAAVEGDLQKAPEGSSTRSSAACRPVGAADKRSLFEHGGPLRRQNGQVAGLNLFDGIAEGEYFYFTHSYIAPDTPYTVAETVHSVRFPSAVQAGDRVFGVQFHPEKSSDAGARLLANFVRIARAARGMQ